MRDDTSARLTSPSRASGLPGSAGWLIALRCAWQMSWKRPGRTILLLLQFLIGTGLLVLGAMAATNAAQEVRVLSRVFGPGVLGCWPAYSRFSEVTRNVRPTNLSDVEALAELPAVSSLAGVLERYFGMASIVSPVPGEAAAGVGTAPPEHDLRSFAEPLVAYGITPEYLSLFNLELAAGRTFVETDYREGEPVALITSALLSLLSNGRLDPQSAVGMTLVAGNQAETPIYLSIVGVLEPTSLLPGHPIPGVQPQVWQYEPVILVPSRTAGVWVASGEADELSYVWIRVPGSATRQDGEMVASLLESRHPGSTYEFSLKLEQVLQEWAQTKPILSILVLFALGALALAAFGLSGVTLGTLAQRRAEIGLRRAIGATSVDVVRQVAMEVVTPAALGGALGAVVAAAVMSAIDDRPMALLPWWVPLLSALIAVAAAVGPSLLYARIAAQRDASELLRGG